MSTPKRHSFIRQTWGHALHIKTVEPGVLKGLMHSRSPINVGDELEWKVALGRNIGKVTECRWMGDPDDMYDVTVVVTERIPEERDHVAEADALRKERKG